MAAAKPPTETVAALVHTTVGTDLDIGVFKVHPVRGGALPSGEDSSEVGGRFAQFTTMHWLRVGIRKEDVLDGSIQRK